MGRRRFGAASLFLLIRLAAFRGCRGGVCFPLQQRLLFGGDRGRPRLARGWLGSGWGRDTQTSERGGGAVGAQRTQTPQGRCGAARSAASRRGFSSSASPSTTAAVRGDQARPRLARGWLGGGLGPVCVPDALERRCGTAGARPSRRSSFLGSPFNNSCCSGGIGGGRGLLVGGSWVVAWRIGSRRRKAEQGRMAAMGRVRDSLSNAPWGGVTSAVVAGRSGTRGAEHKEGRAEQPHLTRRRSLSRWGC